MKYDPKVHHRRSIRLQGYDYTQPGAYYITIVTQGREDLFGDVVNGKMILNRFGQVAQTEWERLPRRFQQIELGEFVIMPNHAHGIIMIVDGRGTAEGLNNQTSESSRRAPTAEGLNNQTSESYRDSPTEQFGKPVHGSIPTIIRSYKSAVALRVNLMRGIQGQPVWQRNYYEHIIRDSEDYLATSNYILNNPLNWETDDEKQE